MKIKHIKKYIIIGLLLLMVSLMSGCTMFASEYTKQGLNPRFSELFNSMDHPDNTSFPIGIVGANPNIIANVLVYPYYAYLDYSKGTISKKQFLKVMANTKGGIDYLNQLFNENYAIVIKEPIKNINIGESYYEVEPNGAWNANTVNYVKICKKMSDLSIQMYQSQDPQTVFNDIKEYAVLLEQSTFYISANDQYGLDDTINVNNFQERWLLKNVYISLDSVQTALNTKGELPPMSGNSYKGE